VDRYVLPFLATINSALNEIFKEKRCFKFLGYGVDHCSLQNGHDRLFVSVAHFRGLTNRNGRANLPQEYKKTACVVNSGGKSNVAGFLVATKCLIALKSTVRELGFNQTNPLTGPPNTVSDILFNKGESQLLISVKGTPNGTAGFIASYSVESQHEFSLATSPIKSTPEHGVLPFSMYN